jgi:hypothetical protein
MQHAIQVAAMALIYIDFEWWRDAKGYRLEHGRIVGNGGKDLAYRPLDEFSTLYTVFAKTPQTPEGLLDFVRKFGRLTLDSQDRPKGDDVRKVLPNIETISMVLGMLAGGKLPRDKQGGPFKYTAKTAMGDIVVPGGVPLPGKLRAWLAPDPTTGAWRMKLQPPSLLDAIWLQLGQAITSNADLRSCAHCGNWFQAGGRSGRRADAKFCSDECRIDFNSLRRSQTQ